MKNGTRRVQFLIINPHGTEVIDADIILESPVSLTVNGKIWLTFMCTPVNLEALAIGFLFNEGIINSKDEIASVQVCSAGDNIDVWLTHPVDEPENWRRTSGCTGGITSIDRHDYSEEIKNGSYFRSGEIKSLISQLYRSQPLYHASGGVHTSAICDREKIITVCEDIGRHNTLDKLAGQYLLENMNVPSMIILTTGRISSEMIQKAARMKALVVISKTSPSSLSMEMADKWGITLIGYAQQHRFNIYTHPERIMAESTETIQ